MRVILLGTGCPLPALSRSGPSQAISAGGDWLLIDCGDGTLTQLMRAGIEPTSVRHLFFTHHHFDHNVGYASFALATWIMGRKHLHVYGPRGTTRMTDLLFKDVFKDDIESRVGFEDRPPAGILNIETTEVGEGVVCERDGWKVLAAKVNHVDLDSLAYRIEHNGKSVVVSGDTTYSEALIRLAEGADILIQSSPLFKGPGETFQNVRPELWEKLRGWHATPEQISEMASRARVRTLVLSHLVPTEDLQGMVEAHSKVFGGKIIVGEDLAVIEC